jgi:hypothetical protein
MTTRSTFEDATQAREWSINEETLTPDLMGVFNDAINEARTRQPADPRQERVAAVMAWLLDDDSLDWALVEQARDRWT